MAKDTSKTKEEKDDVIAPEQQALAYLKANKTEHYNFEETINYKVRSSSLLLTATMNGGCHPSANRAMGYTTGGKTSCTLDFMYHFLLRGVGHRGLYVKSEGRLPEEIRLRSGVTFTTNPEEWADGTCLVLESNVFEFVFGFMGDLIRNNPTKTKYFFIIDSMDMMAKKADLEKGLEEAGQVAGGALITSVFLKKTSVALAKRGHICWFISQVRQEIKINPYEKTPPRQGGASGGNAVAHSGDDCLEFLPRFNDDIILENPNDRNSKPIGHYCKVKILKSNTEKYGTIVRYPIKYGRTGAKSVWVEREIIDLMLAWGLLEKGGAWFKIDPKLREEILASKLDFPEKVQGLDNLYLLLENDSKLTEFLYQKFLKIICRN